MGLPSAAGLSDRPSSPSGIGSPAWSSSVGNTSMPRATVDGTAPARTPGPAMIQGTLSVES
jgi:hypothetical protein